MNTNEYKLAVSIKEASELCGIGYAILRKWADHDPQFPAFSAGNKTVIPVELLREYLNEKARRRDGYPVRA